jgi:hypothetical protein
MALAVCSAAISLLLLIACPVASAASQHGVSIKVFTSQDDQFWTNSVMIEGVHEVMLVDAQLTKTNAERENSRGWRCGVQQHARVHRRHG